MSQKHLTLKQRGKLILHRLHWTTHLSYFGLVSWEAHGLYGVAAALLFGFVLVERELKW